MAKPPDPFAGAKLSEQVGLDQRLFQNPPVSQPSETPEEGTSVRKDERTSIPPEGRKEGRPQGRPKERRAGKTKERSSRRPEESPLPWPGQKQRLIDHRPYDFFQDQIRWLNRKKIEFEEEYGKRVPANAMVQLAVDLLIADFEVNQEESQVVRVLIKDERPSVPNSGRPEEETLATEAEEGTNG